MMKIYVILISAIQLEAQPIMIPQRQRKLSRAIGRPRLRLCRA